jgi:hypothetical protein
LRTPTWTTASAVRNGCPTRNERYRYPSGASSLAGAVLDVDDLHALLFADRADTADAIGARHVGGAVEAARAVGDERLGPGILEGAQHGAQCLGVGCDGCLRRSAAQEVDLDRDPLARRDDAGPTAERFDEEVERCGQAGTVCRAHVGDERWGAIVLRAMSCVPSAVRSTPRVRGHSAFSATIAMLYRPTSPGDRPPAHAGRCR